MTVAKRLYLLIFSAVVGLVCLSALSMIQTQKVYTAASYAHINTVPSLHALDAASTAVANMRAQLWQHIALSEQAKKDEVERSINTNHAKAVEAFDKYEKEYISDAKDRELLAANRSALAEYDALRARAQAFSKTGKVEEARDLILANLPVVNKMVDVLDTHRQHNTELGKAGADAAAVTMQHSSRLAIAIVLLVIAVIVGIGLVLVRSLLKQLGAEPNEAAELAQCVAAGQLNVPISLKTGDTSSLMAQLKSMQESLLKVVSSVRQSSDAVSNASAEIAQGNHDLSGRTEQQASALEETAASMEQLSSTVKQNADNARQANVLAVHASTVALKGGESVAQVVQTMKGINESSRKIADIIGVIDGIAFQTNILALNAAVEAARAGEQGRGFAVVASEVRSLAGRSAEAAKEIKALIETSVERVEQGTALVDQAGATMTEVIGSIRRVSDIVAEISAANSEQSAGVSQVGEAVVQMDQATQQNAALVEQMAAAASSLRTLAADLVGTVSVFKLPGGGRALVV